MIGRRCWRGKVADWEAEKLQLAELGQRLTETVTKLRDDLARKEAEWAQWRAEKEAEVTRVRREMMDRERGSVGAGVAEREAVWVREREEMEREREEMERKRVALVELHTRQEAEWMKGQNEMEVAWMKRQNEMEVAWARERKELVRRQTEGEARMEKERKEMEERRGEMKAVETRLVGGEREGLVARIEQLDAMVLSLRSSEGAAWHRLHRTQQMLAACVLLMVAWLVWIGLEATVGLPVVVPI